MHLFYRIIKFISQQLEKLNYENYIIFINCTFSAIFCYENNRNKLLRKYVCYGYDGKNTFVAIIEL